MSRRAGSEGFLALFGTPTGAAVLAAVGLVGAVVQALSDETAAAIVTAAILLLLTALAVYALWVNAAFDGPYRILQSATTWDLKNPDGSEAEATKRLTVRFNYRTKLLPETASTDTGVDPFREFSAEHGRQVGDAIQSANEWHAVILLHHEAQRGDKRELVSKRVMRDQFPRQHGEWIEMTHSQRGKTTVTILWPPSRPPLRPTLWSSRTDRTVSIADELVDQGGRMTYVLNKRARRGERHRIQWDWAEPRPDSEPSA